MKKIRHSKLPITLESSDRLTLNMLKAISLNMEWDGWEAWIDEYGNWYRPFDKNYNQFDLFDKSDRQIKEEVNSLEELTEEGALDAKES